MWFIVWLWARWWRSHLSTKTLGNLFSWQNRNSTQVKLVTINWHQAFTIKNIQHDASVVFSNVSVNTNVSESACSSLIVPFTWASLRFQYHCDQFQTGTASVYIELHHTKFCLKWFHRYRSSGTKWQIARPRKQTFLISITNTAERWLALYSHA